MSECSRDQELEDLTSGAIGFVARNAGATGEMNQLSETTGSFIDGEQIILDETSKKDYNINYRK